MITAKNISYQINGKPILHPMSFEAEPGAVTVLLGANGAGKSTLLRLLAGENQPEQGTIWLNDDMLQKLSPQSLARKRAVLTQRYSVPLPFTCEEIVMMGRYPHEGISTTAENKKIVAYCMKEMEVQQFATRMFGTLSGGEQQRIQMARVLAQLAPSDGTAGRPANGYYPKERANEGPGKILLLDEPTSSLDYLQQQLILSKTRSLASKGYTVIVVLHDLNLAAQYADKILLLKEGYLLADGTCDEVLRSTLISMAYDLDVDIITHEDYPFPILIPALHNQNRFFQFNKTNKNGTYSNQAVIE